MFRKYTPTHKRTHSRGAVNLDKHLSRMSPSEIIDEMEYIFFDEDNSDIDPDIIDQYLDHLDKVAPIREPENIGEIESFDTFCTRNSAIIESVSNQACAPKPRKSPKRIYRVTLVAALICVLLFAGTAVSANNTNTPLAQWIQNTFTFNSIKQTEYNSLQEALDSYQISEKLIPTWLPTGFAVSDVSVHNANSFTMFSAQYTNDEEKVMTITIKQLSSHGGAVYEKGHDIQSLNINGTEYYIMDNFEKKTILWCVGQFECCISGDIEEEDILPIINSIS